MDNTSLPPLEPLPTEPAAPGHVGSGDALGRLPTANATLATAPVHTGTAAPAAAAPVIPVVMDFEFITKNQIVERYLGGKLPIRGVMEFERYCREHPELLDEIGLADRVNTGLRLLEAGGKPEPWQEPVLPAWRKPQVLFGTAGAALALLIALIVVGGKYSDSQKQLAAEQKKVVEQPLEPVSVTRPIVIIPSRTGVTSRPVATIGAPGEAQLADLKIDMSRSPFRAFRVTIDRVDQGRVGIIHNLMKDSNDHLRIALNSSALGPGIYQFAMEGLTWKGETVPDAWVTIAIDR